jgi:hypothetical protein
VDNNLRSPNSLASAQLQTGGSQQQIQVAFIHILLASTVEKTMGSGEHPLRVN